MHFFESGLTRDGSGGMLVEWPEMARELELLVDVDFLVAEDCADSSVNRPFTYFTASCMTYRQLPVQQRATH